MSTQQFRARHTARIKGTGERNGRLSVFLGDRVLTQTHRGHVIYTIPHDLDLTPSLLLHGRWESHVEASLTALVRPGDTVIDVGSNIGYHTLAMAAAVGPDGHVHAFEANPDVMRLLRATMFVNGFSSWLGSGRVCLYQSAVLDKAGVITLASAPGHYGSGHVLPNQTSFHPAYSTRMEVPAVVLDMELADRVVDVIHMDVEGSEPLVLHGAQMLIERSPHIKIISEWSVAMMKARVRVEEYISWLVERDFKFWLIESDGALTKVDRSKLLELPLCDLVFSRTELRTHPWRQSSRQLRRLLELCRRRFVQDD